MANSKKQTNSFQKGNIVYICPDKLEDLLKFLHTKDVKLDPTLPYVVHQVVGSNVYLFGVNHGLNKTFLQLEQPSSEEREVFLQKKEEDSKLITEVFHVAKEFFLSKKIKFSHNIEEEVAATFYINEYSYLEVVVSIFINEKTLFIHFDSHCYVKEKIYKIKKPVEIIKILEKWHLDYAEIIEAEEEMLKSLEVLHKKFKKKSVDFKWFIEQIFERY